MGFLNILMFIVLMTISANALTVREILGDDYIKYKAQGISDSKIEKIASERLKNSPPQTSQVPETNLTTHIQQEPTPEKNCSLDVSEITRLLIPISLIVLFFVLLVNGVRELVKFFYNAQEEKLYKSLLKILTIAYISFGFLIFFIPPQYFSEDYQYQVYGKFVWVWNLRKIDYTLMGFEIFGYLLLGSILYIFLNKIYKKS